MVEHTADERFAEVTVDLVWDMAISVSDALHEDAPFLYSSAYSSEVYLERSVVRWCCCDQVGSKVPYAVCGIQNLSFQLYRVVRVVGAEEE